MRAVDSPGASTTCLMSQLYESSGGWVPRFTQTATLCVSVFSDSQDTWAQIDSLAAVPVLTVTPLTAGEPAYAGILVRPSATADAANAATTVDRKLNTSAPPALSRVRPQRRR